MEADIVIKTLAARIKKDRIRREAIFLVFEVVVCVSVGIFQRRVPICAGGRSELEERKRDVKLIFNVCAVKNQKYKEENWDILGVNNEFRVSCGGEGGRESDWHQSQTNEKLERKHAKKKGEKQMYSESNNLIKIEPINRGSE